MSSPNHIAIIMDGNGRWGQKNLKNRLLGHQAGIKNLKTIINFFLKNKIKNLTLFALSRDNLLKRNQKELKNIFNLLEKYLTDNQNFFISNKINLKIMGETNNLPEKIKKIIKSSNIKYSFKSNNLKLHIAFNYSSKIEIINAVKKIKPNKGKITLKNVEKKLYTHPVNDPDLIIRTGGRKRLSDFLLWQASYSEIFFVNTLWPDFKIRNLKDIINKFKKVKKNYGA